MKNHGINISRNVCCPICKATRYFELTYLFKLTKSSGAICRDCGCVFLNPRHNGNWYRSYYQGSNERLKDNQQRRKQINVYANRQYLKASSIHEYIKKKFPDFDIKEKSILELGCTSGGILKYFYDQGAKRTVGLDPEPEYVDYGKKKLGLEIYEGFIEDFKSKNKFDLIIMRHVVEHLLDPVKDLERAYELLNDQGLLFVETPSLYSMNMLGKWKENFLTEHPTIFSYKTLPYLLNKCGFNVELLPMKGNRSHLRVLAKKKRDIDITFNGDNWIWVVFKCLVYDYSQLARRAYYSIRNKKK